MASIIALEILCDIPPEPSYVLLKDLARRHGCWLIKRTIQSVLEELNECGIAFVRKLRGPCSAAEVRGVVKIGRPRDSRIGLAVRKDCWPVAERMASAYLDCIIKETHNGNTYP